MMTDREDVELTAAGWPRPWRADVHGQRFPVPWVTAIPNFATMDPERRAATTCERLCQVCGEGHEPGADVVVFCHRRLRDRVTGGELHLAPDADLAAIADQIMVPARDGAIMHERCARLAIKHCPALRRYHDSGSLLGFVGPVESIEVHPESDEDGQGAEVDLVLLGGSTARPWVP